MNCKYWRYSANSTNLVKTNTTLPSYICISEVNSNETSNETTAHEMKSEDVTNETVGFMSENIGYQMTMPTVNEAELKADSLNSFEFAKFLSRPVKILSFTWLETDIVSVLQTVEPWYAFFNDQRIKNKLHNFAFMQCSLKVKIVINASPFYYGAMMASYQPLPNFTTAVIPSTTGNQFLIPYSQRPHVWIYPQANQGADMELPFFYHKQWVQTHLIQDFKDLGKLSFIPFTTLQSANGTTGTGVTVSVFAWAENVEVTGPTVGLALAQAGDEYTGSISQPSSMVANIASKLTSIPVIGTFALATQVGASAIARIAHMFGFTNPPVLTDVEPVRARPLHNLADTSIGYVNDKLTVDSKNELGISSDILGHKEEDPLVISNFIARESFLIAAPWDTIDTADTILFSTPVSPTMCSVDPVSPTNIIFGTPMSHIASMFEFWRGDIIFRFHIIASQFHKGRIRIQWDPAGYTGENVISDSNAYSGCFNQIVDLGKDTNVEIRVPYLQAYAFLRNDQYGNGLASVSASPSFLYDSSKFNGTLVIRVVTQLTAPVATSTVNILVSVRAANVEFANPSFYAGESRRYSPLPPQGAEEYDDAAEEIAIASPSRPPSHIYLLHFGEQVVSLRQLLKRMAYVNTITSAGSAESHRHDGFNLYRVPMTYGYQNNGINTATAIVGTGNKNFNANSLNAITWLMPCFIAQRGSINYSVSMFTTTTAQSSLQVSVARRPWLTVANPNNYTLLSSAGNGASIAKDFQYLPTLAGSTVHPVHSNGGFEFQVPNFSRMKFQNCNVANANAMASYDDSQLDTFNLDFYGLYNVSTSRATIFAGAGPDFNLAFFLNVPPIYYYTSVPPVI